MNIRSMHRIFATLLLLVSVFPATVAGCSVIDGTDGDQIEDAIDGLPRQDRDSIAAMVIAAKTRKFLNKKDPRTQILSVTCQHHYANGDVSKFTNEVLTATVTHMLACLGRGDMGYTGCLTFLNNLIVSKTDEAWVAYKKTLPDGNPIKAANTKCTGVVEDEFLPQEVPGATDDLNRVTAKDCAKWIFEQPVMPSGLSPATLRALLPFICRSVSIPLAVSWGCPGYPSGGGPTIVESGGAGAGDYP